MKTHKLDNGHLLFSIKNMPKNVAMATKYNSKKKHRVKYYVATCVT